MIERQGISSVANQQRILFDHKWYSLTYMGRLAKSDEALRHFLEQGYPAGHNPHPLFFTGYYLSQLPQGESAPRNPILHYIETGAELGMNPCPLFTPDWYSEKYGITATGLAPLAHYIRYGIPERLDPNEYFDAAAYEAAHAGEDKKYGGYGYALLHYMFTADKQLQDPSERFCTKDYLELNPDALKEKVNPLRHYLERGKGQLRHVRWPKIDYSRLVPPYKYAPSELSHPPRAGEPALQGSAPKIVIYTALTGDYSRLLPPTALTPGSRYVCYSDKDRETWGVWELRALPFKEADPQSASRRVKTHPWELFPEADWAIWCDANIIINGDLSGFIEQVRESGLPMGLMPHPTRDCLYDEAEACILAGKGNADAIRAQVDHYRAQGCPEHYGLMASGFFVANLRHPQTRPLFETWWNELSRHGKRDQLSLPFAFYALGIEQFYMTGRNESIWNDPRLIYILHEATWNVKVPDRLKTDQTKQPD
ncbi:DUF616 domain-containing protein [Desulfovibrio sp. OttesenSCG-928-C06]|nr:DUF616 domain-containing protein [Desulfovibrio sp. OttesenSCG-928-C06]